jgi:hypothetical protein
MSIEANIASTDGFFRGEDKTLRFTVVDDGDNPVNITGWTITFTMSASQHGAQIAGLTKTVGSGITLTSPASGILDVTILDTDTVAQGPAIYYYSLRRTNAGFAAELAFGSIDLREEYVDY